MYIIYIYRHFYSVLTKREQTLSIKLISITKLSLPVVGSINNLLGSPLVSFTPPPPKYTSTYPSSHPRVFHDVARRGSFDVDVSRRSTQVSVAYRSVACRTAGRALVVHSLLVIITINIRVSPITVSLSPFFFTFHFGSHFGS